MTEREIFLAAIEIADPAERTRWVEHACGADVGLRTQVVALLEAHAKTSEFLETPATALDASVSPTIMRKPAETDDDADDEPTSGEAEFRRYLQRSTRPGWLGRLAHYEIETILGRGAFGIVAKAFDEKLHRVVAIKLMNPELALTSPPRKRFLREARSAAAVAHENIVAIHAVEEEPIPYLVMEYVPGQTLQQRMDANGPLDIVDILQIGQQIAAGLAAAHAANMIHRDIKPSNILLTGGPADRVKISDFGLARAVDDASMTSSGTIAGTPMYMAPEQARGEPLDHRADLFSLGSVLYQMASGRPPFRAASTVAVLKRVCEDRPRPIDDVLPGVPGWLEAIIFKLLEKNREDRYQTAGEVADLFVRCQREIEHSGHVAGITRRGIPAEEPLGPPAQNGERKTAGRWPIGWLAGGVGLLTLSAVITVFSNLPGGFRGPDADSSAVPVDFNGLWETSIGLVSFRHLPAHGNEPLEVHGRYHNDTHCIDGLIDPKTRTLTGTFGNCGRPWGNLKLVQSTDGQRIQGRYAQDFTSELTMVWNMTRLSSVLAPVDFNGTWDSSWGPVTLTHATTPGSERFVMNGTYTFHGANEIYGTVDPKTRTFRGRFEQGEQHGRLQLTLSDDGQSIRGWYDYLTNESFDASQPRQQWNMIRRRDADTVAPPSGPQSEQTGPSLAQTPALAMMDRSTVWSDPVNLGPGINSAGREANPSLTDDELLIAFTRAGELYEARRASRDQPFEPAKKLSTSFSTVSGNISCSLSGDGLLMAITSAVLGEKQEDILLCSRVSRDEPFGPPQRLPEPINSPFTDRHPVLSPDGLRLALTTNRNGVKAGSVLIFQRPNRDAEFQPTPLVDPQLQIGWDTVSSFARDGSGVLKVSMSENREQVTWHARSQPDGPFAPGIPLGPPLDGIKFSAPFLSADGQTLYFHSRGLPGSHGDLDLWMTRRKSQ